MGIRQWALALECTEKPDQMLEIPVCPKLVDIIKRLLESRITMNQPSFDTAKQVCQDLEIHVDETKKGMDTLRSMLYSETKLRPTKRTPCATFSAHGAVFIRTQNSCQQFRSKFSIQMRLKLINMRALCQQERAELLKDKDDTGKMHLLMKEDLPDGVFCRI